jgi:hypothetical protein
VELDPALLLMEDRPDGEVAFEVFEVFFGRCRHSHFSCRRRMVRSFTTRSALSAK